MRADSLAIAALVLADAGTTRAGIAADRELIEISRFTLSRSPPPW